MRKWLFIFFGVATLSFLPLNISVDNSSNKVTVSQQSAYAQVDCDAKGAPACSLAQRVSNPDGFVYKTWIGTRGVINVLLILALLLISFSNITHGLFGINLDSYTIKKALPNLFVGIILANASLLIIRYLADISTVVVYFFVEQALGSGADFKKFITDVVGTVGIKTIVSIGSSWVAGIAAIIYLVLGIIIAVGSIWLAIILYVRLAMIYLLTILSPLAFIAYGIPGMGKYFTQWWQQFIKWLFILPAMCAVFWLMLEIYGDGTNLSVIQVLLTYILFFTALTIPTKWGGAVVDRVSKGFAKYSGVNAAKKYAGETAALAGEGLITRAPILKNIGRFQEWSKQRQENSKKANELARKDLARKAASGKLNMRVKTRFGNLQLARSTGLRTANLSLLEQELNDKQAKVTADQLRAAGNEDVLNRLKIAELEKTAAEKRMEEAKKLHGWEFYKRAQTSDADIANLKGTRLWGEKKFVGRIKKVLEEFADATADEEIISGEVGREEGIIKGNAMNGIYQLPQVLNNYLETKKHIEFLEKQEQTEEVRHELEKTTGQLQSMQLSFESMKKKGKAKIGDFDLSQMTIEQAHKLMDKDSQLAKDNASVHRLAVGQQRQAMKSFNAGVQAQIKDEIKEQTVPQLQRELDDFLDKTLGGLDVGKIKTETGIEITQEQIKEAYFKGDFALLSAIGVKDHEVRNGRVIAEKFKTIEKSINDIRHSDASLVWMDATNKNVRPDENGNPVYTNEEFTIAREGNNNQKKILSAKLTSNGAQAGSPGNVIQTGSNIDRKERDYRIKKAAGNTATEENSNERKYYFTDEDVAARTDTGAEGLGDLPPNLNQPPPSTGAAPENDDDENPIIDEPPEEEENT